MHLSGNCEGWEGKAEGSLWMLVVRSPRGGIGHKCGGEIMEDTMGVVFFREAGGGGNNPMHTMISLILLHGSFFTRFSHAFIIFNYWNFDIGMHVLRSPISHSWIKKMFEIINKRRERGPYNHERFMWKVLPHTLRKIFPEKCLFPTYPVYKSHFFVLYILILCDILLLWKFQNCQI